MGNWKELLINMLKLTDEVKRLNRSVEQLESYTGEVDKRVVRLETIIEIAKARQQGPAGQVRIEPK